MRKMSIIKPIIINVERIEKEDLELLSDNKDEIDIREKEIINYQDKIDCYKAEISKCKILNCRCINRLTI